MERRQFIKKSARGVAACAVASTGLGLLGVIVTRPPQPDAGAGEPVPLRPPGALPEPAFRAACIRCQRCRDACPSGAIQLAQPGAAVPAGTPFLAPRQRACHLCLACTTACPTGALQPLQRAEDADLGLAVVDERLCVSHNGSGVCGACHTACPLHTRAIKQGLRNTPTVVADACVGCGMCEEVCIVKGTSAIRVFPRPVKT